MPTKSEILNWRTDHLGAAAKTWGDQATQLDTAVNGAQGLLDGLQGSGQFVEAFRTRLKSYIDKTRPKVDKLKSAKQVAESSEQQLKGAKDKAVYAVHDPEDEDFNVNEDLSVTERRSHSGLDRLKRAIRRRWLQGILHTRAQELVATDNAIARKLHEIAHDLSNFHLEGPDGNTDFSGEPDPRILGPGGPLTHETDSQDLDATIPGTGIRLGGDGRDGYPTIDIPGVYSGQNPLEVPDGSRPLPTGAAAGPDGSQFAGYSVLPYGYKINGEEVFAAGDTTIANLSDPAHPIGTLKGISQASFVYDPDKNRMIIVGNETNDPNAPNGRTRVMWEVPYDRNNPNSWASKTPTRIGEVPSLPGNRESQLVALKGGGFALVGADNGHPSSAIAASTPEGLRDSGLRATAITPPQYYPPNPPGHPPGWDTATPYAPVVVDQHYDPGTGRVTLDMRQSTWGWLPDPNKPGKTLYDPHTWTTSIVVQQPGH
ncbi:hypothetical protein [Mycobacteroides abscessus]|uniref:hypothetical protein n=1 Tax=Mycobacteroides abscessus TaxID=36809 RepID=UPI0009297674|nr:hypothetical protein [Mycobacteroides abscessus]MBN7457615.1 hypothetical protein [Mycobacteroides abscessus subsp. abscessus]MBN7546381.1 hypothetical protein [Mycobacteroides abscessus subsp. abscessus]MBN7570297.1 hypothetical protein [Mycobacteroides abscessus subsp. abscessus]QSM94304.1 hypothetical protein I3U31_00085 [Mycobacteroides abscessus subsp. abscessus]QSM99339.1 hypothetical protein I3U40_00085 [Mycobacteroides abscessus subsp. abscessus]